MGVAKIIAEPVENEPLRKASEIVLGLIRVSIAEPPNSPPIIELILLAIIGLRSYIVVVLVIII